MSINLERIAVAARLFALTMLAALTFLSQSAAEEKALKGIALVIGNGDYEHIAKLPNPPNDARAIEERLAELGFETTVSSDRDARRLKRDLDAFGEDAEGADVAFLYYSGHGIEAGGENYLVPVDADLSALEEATEKLVPLSTLVERLKAVVPVVIVMLDACRDNPFPPDALVKSSRGDTGVPIDATGLGAGRGAKALGSTAGADEIYGAMLGFAAEPGKTALDGPEGGNSPYAAAILRHLSALGGQEFGLVMRMVAEEVYLKTSGRQRPWVNENMRRLLYFGGTAVDPQGDAGEILGERRQLLLTIATLPDASRRQVETIAGEGKVPMDAVYGMLKALGTEAPSDPAQLDALLRSQTDKVKSLLAERDALKSSDPEIARLASLSDEAMSEGALSTAIKLLDQAKTRVGTLRETVDDAEADVRRKRLEFAAIYAKSAEARSVAFEYLGAAEDYARAYDEVRRWDGQLAWTYKNGETRALIDHGTFKVDNAALLRAIDAGEVALGIATGFPERLEWATTKTNIGNAQQTLGARESGNERLEASVITFRDAARYLDPVKDAARWSANQNNLGNALQALGERGSDTRWLDEAVTAYQSSLKSISQETQPFEWGLAWNNLGNTLAIYGIRSAQMAKIGEAIDAYEKSLAALTYERWPHHWASVENNLGRAYLTIGENKGDKASLGKAQEAFLDALDGISREAVPLTWATIQNNLANTFQALGALEPDNAAAFKLHSDAATAYTVAMEEMTRERVPLQWATAMNNLGNSLQSMSFREADTARKIDLLNRSAEAQQQALTEFTPDGTPLLWATAQHNLGLTLANRGFLEESVPTFRLAVEAYERALSRRPKDQVPLDWARSMTGLAEALRVIGFEEKDTAQLRKAKALVQESWDHIKALGFQHDPYFQDIMRRIDATMAGVGAGKP